VIYGFNEDKLVLANNNPPLEFQYPNLLDVFCINSNEFALVFKDSIAMLNVSQNNIKPIDVKAKIVCSV
jgi:hypothetical protein